MKVNTTIETKKDEKLKAKTIKGKLLRKNYY